MDSRTDPLTLGHAMWRILAGANRTEQDIELMKQIHDKYKDEYGARSKTTQGVPAPKGKGA